jgi:two-component system sensor histidine kinase KdpD
MNHRRTIELRPWILTWLALIAATAAMLAVRPSLEKVHVALVFLLVVLGGSAVGGRVLGLVVAGVAFLSFDYLFLPPYYTLALANPLDWLVLVAFLATSIVAAQLLNVAQERAEAERRRAEEVERLASLGAETLNAGGAEAGLKAIVEMMRTTLGVEQCAVYALPWPGDGRARAWPNETHGGETTNGGAAIRLLATAGVPPAGTSDAPAPQRRTEARAEPQQGLVMWVALHGQAVAERVDGTSRIASRLGLRRRGGRDPGGDSRDLSSDADPVAELASWHEAQDTRMLAIPLQVRGRTVGVLKLERRAGIQLRPEQVQFLRALAYYAALGVDRVRLIADGERAEALREADRLKDALLASVSHDLRTPLTTIRALAHDLASGGDAKAVSIEEEANRLNRLVSDVLDLSRLMGGALPIRIELNTAEDLIGAAAERVRGLRQGRELRIGADPSAEVLVGRFDFVHALRVLTNLIENALKYSPNDSAIELDVVRVARAIRFRVSDRGPGIPETERERIFEAFYRPPGSPSDSGSAGLGLSIARGLADAQGGSLRYEPRPGGGSTFVFDLPAAESVPTLR